MAMAAHQLVRLKLGLDAKEETKRLQTNALRFAVTVLIMAKISVMMAIQ